MSKKIKAIKQDQMIRKAMRDMAIHNVALF